MSNIKISLKNSNHSLNPAVTKVVVASQNKVKKVILKGPVTIHKDSNLSTYLCEPGTSNQSSQCSDATIIKDEKSDAIVYRSVKGDFFKGNTDRSMLITHGIDPITHAIRTKACITKSGNEIITEITSDDFVSAVGQFSYETVFKALLTVPNEELKVQAMLALLTAKLKSTTEECSSSFTKPFEKFSNPQIKETYILKKDTKNEYEQKTINPVFLTNGNVFYIKSPNMDQSEKIHLALDRQTKSCQTDESSFRDLNMFKTRRRYKRALASPYVITDLHLNRLSKTNLPLPPVKMQSEKTKKTSTLSMEKDDLQSLKLSWHDDSTNISNLSVALSTNTDLLNQITNSILIDPVIKENHPGSNPESSCKTHLTDWSIQRQKESAVQAAKSFDSTNSGLSHIEEKIGHQTLTSDHPKPLSNPQTTQNSALETNWYPIKMLDGYTIMVPVKPEDESHVATQENIASLNTEDKKKLILHQMCIDFKCALEEDEYGNLPIHRAVLANDAEWLRRQGIALKARGETVDVAAEGWLTSLKMSVYKDTTDCCVALLELGADPLLADGEGQAILHLAADRPTDHLHDALHMCKLRVRAIISNHNDVPWPEGWQTKTDDELAQILMDHLCTMVDDQGYTPLMLASKIGNYNNVRLLVEASPRCVDFPMPNSGNTALYLAIGAACMDAGGRANKSQVADNFSKTIEMLITNGANINTENHTGNTPSLLLQENQNDGLNSLISKVMSSKNNALLKNSYESLMIIKDKDGNCHKYGFEKKQKAVKTCSAGDYASKASPRTVRGENRSEKNVPTVEPGVSGFQTTTNKAINRENKVNVNKTSMKEKPIVLATNQLSVIPETSTGIKYTNSETAQTASLSGIKTIRSGTVVSAPSKIYFPPIAPKPISLLKQSIKFVPQVGDFKTFKLVNKKLVDRTKNKVKILKNTLIKNDDPILKSAIEQLSGTRKLVIHPISCSTNEPKNMQQSVVQAKTTNKTDDNLVENGNNQQVCDKNKRKSPKEDGVNPKKLKKS